MKFDVIVAGAGPAGCTCALFLAQEGKKVLVLEKEKFPRDKVCADNKTWKCLDIVKELGLWKEFMVLPKKEITGVLIASPAGHDLYASLPQEKLKEKGPWYNVKRIFFDNMLAKACRRNKNILFMENAEVLAPILEGENVVGVKFRDGKGRTEQAFAGVVVAADGSQSVLAKSLGLDPVLKGRFAMNLRAYYKGVKGCSNACELYYLKGICPGYFWIFPVDKDACNVGIGMRLEDIEKQGPALQQKLEETIRSKRFANRFVNARRVSDFGEWGLSVVPGKRKWCGNGFVLVGDAGTFAMAFSGEGVGPGMRSGKVAAHAILRAFARNDLTANSLSDYDESMWAIMGPELEGFKYLEFLVLHERIFDFVVKKARGKKELLDLCSRMQYDYSWSKKLLSLETIAALLS